MFVSRHPSDVQADRAQKSIFHQFVTAITAIRTPAESVALRGPTLSALLMTDQPLPRIDRTGLQHIDKLGRLDPATGAWTEFPLMSAETDVRRIEVDPNNPKRIWYSGVLSSRMGYIEMLQ